VADQTILTQIRQVVTHDFAAPSSGNTAIPVYFIVRNGVVQLVGTVPTIVQKRRVEAMVRRVPGVVQVIDQLQINATATSSVSESFGSSSAQAGISSNNSSGFSSTNTLTPTGAVSNSVDQATRSTNQSSISSTNKLTPTGATSNSVGQINGNTNQSGSSMETNLPPTSRTNDSNHSSGLPPGLEKRNELPPGLEKRDQLPPGLEGRSNSSGSNP